MHVWVNNAFFYRNQAQHFPAQHFPEVPSRSVAHFSISPEVLARPTRERRERAVFDRGCVVVDPQTADAHKRQHLACDGFTGGYISSWEGETNVPGRPSKGCPVWRSLSIVYGSQEHPLLVLVLVDLFMS